MSETTALTKQPEKKTVDWYMDNQKQRIAEALPSCGLTIDRFTRLAISTLNNSPDLQKCDPISFMKAMMTCAQLGIEPSPVLGTCYLLPFNNKKENKKEVQFILGYKGMITLARRSGEILSFAVRPVYQNDIFKIGFGMDDTLEHVPYGCREDGDYAEPGAFRGVYMVCKFKDGGHLIDYMPKAEIDRHRAKSLAGNFGPWKDFYEEMALKTIIRKNFKYLPSSTDIIQAVESSDDTVQTPIHIATSSDVMNRFQLTQIREETGEIPITSEEMAEVKPADNTDLLQATYQAIDQLAHQKGDSADDTLSEMTNGKLTALIDLEGRPDPFLNDIKLMAENEMLKLQEAA